MAATSESSVVAPSSSDLRSAPSRRSDSAASSGWCSRRARCSISSRLWRSRLRLTASRRSWRSRSSASRIRRVSSWSFMAALQDRARAPLGRLYVDGLGALVAGAFLVGDGGTLGQRAEALGDDVGLVDEEVLAAITRGDEAK